MAIKIVVADDDAITRMDIRECLSYSGYDVVGEAGDGIDAVELCSNLKPDIVLIDVKMPVMDGLTAARLIHESHENIGIVMVTAYNDKQFVSKAADYGVVGYIVKPIDENSLIPTIEIALRRVKELTRLKKELEKQNVKLEERKLVEKAKGIIIRNNGISENDAYKYLRTISMNKRISMSEVAKAIIESDKLLRG